MRNRLVINSDSAFEISIAKNCLDSLHIQAEQRERIRQYLTEQPLVRDNVGLVGEAIAKTRHFPVYVSGDAVFTQGLLGLIEAFDTFDPSGDERFSEYASAKIGQSIRDSFEGPLGPRRPRSP